MDQAVLNKHTAGGIRRAIIEICRHISDQSTYGNPKEVRETIDYLRQLANDIEAGKQ